MQTLSFRELRRSLRTAGVAPSIIDRTIQELKDHYRDAESAARARGREAAAARREARACLGSVETIVAAAAAQRNLLHWRYRWPQSARCVDGLAFCLALPAAPFVYCAAHPASIVRWGLSSGLALCVTASLLFAMQWALSSGSLL